MGRIETFYPNVSPVIRAAASVNSHTADRDVYLKDTSSALNLSERRILWVDEVVIVGLVLKCLQTGFCCPLMMHSGTVRRF